MLYEVIEKNKRKSAIALLVTGVWFTFIYGSICAFLLFSVIAQFLDSKALNTITHYNYLIFASGAVIALLIFIFQFLHEKNKPYKIEGCGVYRVTKKNNMQLYNIVQEIQIASGNAYMPAVYVLNSDILNAYACGVNPKNASVVVSKGLLELLSREELQGVIAHEMSHIMNRDTMYLLCSGLLFGIASGFTAMFFASAKRGGKGSGGALILAVISRIGQSICYILFLFVSRKREYLADASGAMYTRNPKGLADALLKIEKASKKSRYNVYDDLDENNANHLVKASFFIPVKDEADNWKSTHPSTENRIKILLNMTSADFKEYERVFEKINNKKLLPQSALANCSYIPLNLSAPHAGEVPHSGKGGLKNNTAAYAACSLSSVIADETEIRTIKENKELLKDNIKKHREIENLVRDLAGYTIINCTCGTKLKIPPVYKNQIIICPHCGKKHLLQAE